MQPERSVDLLGGYDGMRADYRMYQTGPHRKERSGLPVSGAGADWHVNSQSQYMRMMEMSRDVFQNDPIIGMGIRRLVSNVVGDGFQPDPDTGDETVDVALKDKWKEFASKPEVQGAMSFPELERMVLSSVLRDGDLLAIPVIDNDNTGRLELFEGHQLRDPSNTQGKNVVLGVELDSSRRRLAYYVAPGGMTNSVTSVYYGTATHRIPAYGPSGEELAFHVVFADRLTQTRGVPIIQPVHDFIAYHDDIQFSQLVKQQIASCFVLLRQRAMDGPPMTGGSKNAVSESFSDGKSRNVEELYPGKEIRGAAGETISGFSPNVPNAEYFHHVSLILQIIAVNLNLPVQVLLLDPTQTNYSGWRGAIDQAKQRWREIQCSFADRFHRRVWAWKVREWAATDPYFAAASQQLPFFSRCEWHLPSWPYIDPLKDAQADNYQIQSRLNSPRRVFASRGLEYDTVIEEIISDNSNAIILAKQTAELINGQFPDDDHKVSWQEVLTVPMTNDISMSWSRSDQSNTQSVGMNNAGPANQ